MGIGNSLNIITRPIGSKVIGPLLTATISNNAGDVKFTSPSVTGTKIFIYSIYSAYNGFWTVQSMGGNDYWVLSNNGLPRLEFIQAGTVSFYNTGYHNWNSVHLPIKYVLKSQLWPINAIDTARTVLSFINYNGYTNVLISGDIRSSKSADALEKVKVSGTSALDAVYTIIKWNSDTNFVIDLLYNATNSFSGGTIQYYYNNYHILIRLYAGLNSAHYWGAQKPYVEVAEIKTIPDSDGLATINVSDLIKNQIAVVTNNLLLDYLPNNLDAWCQFYIDYAEGYDDANAYGSNQYIITTDVTDYNTELGGVEPYAVNAMLPFKNRYSGYMSDYISSVGGYQKWLSPFTQPTLFDGFYFDVSFIREANTAGDYIRRDVYLAGVLLHSFTDLITDNDEGVYRYQVSKSSYLEDTIKLTYFTAGNTQLSETLTIDVNTTCHPQDFYLTWLNYLGGYDYWNFTAQKKYTIDIISSKTQTKDIFKSWPSDFGEFAESREFQTMRGSQDGIMAISGLITSDQLAAVKLIVTSPLVQICNSVYDKRTVILDANTLNVSEDQDKTFTVTFNLRYTDENPSQSL